MRAKASEYIGSADKVRASLAEQVIQLEAWHAGGRSNVDFTDRGVRICRGHHDKGASCEWEYYTSDRGADE